MTTPTPEEGRRVESEGRSVLADALIVALGDASRNPALRAPHNLTNCIACGDHFRPSRSWHFLCSQCFAFDCVRRACAQFNARGKAIGVRP